MYKSEYSIYLGREDDIHFVEFLIEDSIYLVLEVQDESTKEEIRTHFKKMKDGILEGMVDNLADFEELIEEELVSKFKKETFSLAAGFLVDKIFYLVTSGGGKIFIRREGKLVELIGGRNKASGYLSDGDIFILASNTFSSLAKNKSLNDKLNKAPKEVIEELTPTLKEEDDIGAIGLFIRWHEDIPATDELAEEQKETVPDKEPKELAEKISEATPGKRLSFNFISNLTEKLKISLSDRQTSRGRKMTAIAVLILAIIFAWSVIFGFQRRAHSELMKKVTKSEELINAKLIEAGDISSLNMERSLILLTEAKDELKKIKEIVGKQEIREVKKIEEKILQKEKEIVKKDEKKSQEFYDLALIEKGALGEKMYLDGETVAILNSSSGKIYTLSLTKKSTRTIKKDEIKRADLVGLYKDDIIFLNKDKGIYKITSDDKSKQIIKKDDDWGDLVGLSIYNGNLYFLDRSKDEIYKYLVGADAYSAKASYFKSGQSVDLADANSLVIDSSVYIGTNKAAYKYTGGLRDGFSTKFPDGDNNEFTKLFTDANNNKVYVLSKDKGKVFILNKNGEYEKQIESGIFKKADDFVVLESEKKIYILVSDKIYSVGTE